MKDSDYRPAPGKGNAKKKQASAAPTDNSDKAIRAAASKKAKWKAQSEMFRAAMRAVKTNDDEPSSGFGGGGMGKASAAVNMEQYDDRTECKWCNRKFAEETAKRHIPVCEQKHKANQMKMKGSAAAVKAGKTATGGFKR